ncbi:MAG: protein jag [Clostridia bacterium]|nr:protein jag [Clostridia bacterium]
MKYFEFTGKTVEEAIELGLQELKVAREEVEITVLEEGKKKLFGSVKAKVQIGVNECAEECETFETTQTGATDGERAVEFLKGLFNVLEIEAEVSLVNESDKIEINVDAQDTKKIIGKHGETIDAIQTLASAVANTGREKYARVVVDCENYRETREATLERLAEKLAEKSIRLGKKIKLEPMNPYERRIIHAKLSEYEGVKTTSEGKEPNRYIVVIPDNVQDPDAPAISARRDDRHGGNDRNRGRNDRGGRGGRNGGYGKKSYNKGGRSNGAASGTSLKNNDFFGTFLGNSKDK